MGPETLRFRLTTPLQDFPPTWIKEGDTVSITDGYGRLLKISWVEDEIRVEFERLDVQPHKGFIERLRERWRGKKIPVEYVSDAWRKEYRATRDQ